MSRLVRTVEIHAVFTLFALLFVPCLHEASSERATNLPTKVSEHVICLHVGSSELLSVVPLSLMMGTKIHLCFQVNPKTLVYSGHAPQKNPRDKVLLFGVQWNRKGGAGVGAEQQRALFYFCSIIFCSSTHCFYKSPRVKMTDGVYCVWGEDSTWMFGSLVNRTNKNFKESLDGFSLLVWRIYDFAFLRYLARNCLFNFCVVSVARLVYLDIVVSLVWGRRFWETYTWSGGTGEGS